MSITAFFPAPARRRTPQRQVVPFLTPPQAGDRRRCRLLFRTPVNKGDALSSAFATFGYTYPYEPHIQIDFSLLNGNDEIWGLQASRLPNLKNDRSFDPGCPVMMEMLLAKNEPPQATGNHQKH